MELDERKLKILAAIVEAYINTGEPVGSKTVCSMLDFPVSSATVRNEMAALSELGILEQPHTSSGRVPSYQGYRIYIDRLMDIKPLTETEKNEIDALFNVKDPDPDKLLQDACEALAQFTSCATVTTTLTPHDAVINRIEIMKAGRTTAVVLVMASNGVVKSKVCRVGFQLSYDVLDFFVKFVNDRFKNRTLENITLAFIETLLVSLGEYSVVFSPLLVSIYEICREIEEGNFILGGQTNLLAYRELNDHAHELFTFLNNRKMLTSLIDSSLNDMVKVILGKEAEQYELEDLGVVVAKYKIGRMDGGAIGVIGPVRIDYSRLIPHLRYFADTLGRLLADTIESQNDQP
ncbi:heat-inducible transcriptional repressor HrcA [Candidatus Soleaferrea massiliensis]|uniref:heat-inducible transcriptional repressor HrcA n=1 Tax=Candidatus Soleaferrea massiliensis TaxID=1470354 RepID=UPI0005902710|nr:heat-inducible transcriptional repressor HrcA [Candidatus Soleaferrea massiliensis]